MRVTLGKFWLVCGFWVTLAGFAQQIEGPVERFPDGPWMVKAFVPDLNIIQEVANFAEPRMVDLEQGSFLLDVDVEGAFRLNQLGCYLVLDEPQTKRLWQVIRRDRSKGGSGIPGFPCYRTVDETFAEAQQWTVDFPDLVEWNDIGDSWLKTQDASMGDDIMVAVLTNKNTTGPKPILFIMAAVHAREYTPGALAFDFAQMLLDGYGQNADFTWLLDEHEVHLVLQANPDGRRRAETGLFWRKNANNDFCTGTNFRGIDLNRNFPFQWGCCGGSSANGCDQTFRGPSATSEPEVLAIRDYVRSIFPDQRGPNISDPAPDDATGIFFDIHSFSELVIWPYGFNSTPTPNGSALQTLGRKFAFYNNYFPEKASVSFTTDGTTDDFAYGELGIAAYTFELGTTFFQPCSDYLNTIKPDNLAALVYAAKVARTPYLTPSGPDVTQQSVSSSSVVLGSTVEIRATLNDGRFSQANGTEQVGTLTGAEVYIDTPPWRGGTPIPMEAVDGTFNQTIEEATVTLDTTGLTGGRHLVYIRGKDENDQWGAPSAVFLQVLDPNAAGTVAGRLTNNPTNIPLAGQIEAGGFSTTSELTDGRYELLLIPNTYSVAATAPDHEPSTVNNVSVMLGQTQNVDIQLQAICPVLSETAEQSSQQWIANGTWQRSSEASFEGEFGWTDSPNGPYENLQDTSLVSPAMDLSAFETVSLRFQHQVEIPDVEDVAYVEVSQDGKTWTSVASYSGQTAAWQLVSIPLEKMAGTKNVQVRFRLQTDAFTAGPGWKIDNIAVLGSGAGCNEAVFNMFLSRWPETASVLNFIPLFP